jgi:hypothetical protein
MSSPTGQGRKKAAHHYLKKKESVKVEDRISNDIMQMEDPEAPNSSRGFSDYKQPIQTYNKPSSKFVPPPVSTSPTSNKVGVAVAMRKKATEPVTRSSIVGGKSPTVASNSPKKYVNQVSKSPINLAKAARTDRTKMEPYVARKYFYTIYFEIETPVKTQLTYDEAPVPTPEIPTLLKEELASEPKNYHMSNPLSNQEVFNASYNKWK